MVAFAERVGGFAREARNGTSMAVALARTKWQVPLPFGNTLPQAPPLANPEFHQRRKQARCALQQSAKVKSRAFAELSLFKKTPDLDFLPDNLHVSRATMLMGESLVLPCVLRYLFEK